LVLTLKCHTHLSGELIVLSHRISSELDSDEIVSQDQPRT